MKLEKAARILEDEMNCRDGHSFTEINQAEQLGIEALKRVIGWRKQFEDEMRVTLPGETEE